MPHILKMHWKVDTGIQTHPTPFDNDICLTAKLEPLLKPWKLWNLKSYRVNFGQLLEDFLTRGPHEVHRPDAVGREKQDHLINMLEKESQKVLYSSSNSPKLYLRLSWLYHKSEESNQDPKAWQKNFVCEPTNNDLGQQLGPINLRDWTKLISKAS